MHPETPRPRRSFIEYREIPGLLAGAALGRDVALRRVLGARKAGRIGAALALGLLAAVATDLRSALLGLAAYAGLAAVEALRWRRSGLGLYCCARLLLWTLPAPLALALLARAAGAPAGALLVLAVLAASVLLERGLARGLGGPHHLAGEAGASEAGRTAVGTGSPGRE